ncbi:MAG: MerR family transcriptional regulator [Clostridiales Family XIII bacterium]|jgi:DNA-binding transcriptional MerR regulator|nr:MerR family transcriptional regulator [Clostridiales Family XIII bacterium]
MSGEKFKNSEKEIPLPSGKNLTISQFARLTGISKSTLMYYDKLGIFRPQERGANNYRKYAPNQLTTINQIRVMSALGMSIKKMQSVVKGRNPESIASIIRGSLHDIDAQIAWLETSKRLAETICQLIDMGMEVEKNGEVDGISIRAMNEWGIWVGEKNEWDGEGSFYDRFGNFLSISKNKGYNPAFPIGGLFESLASYVENSSLPDRFFYVNPDGREVRPAGNYLVGYAYGYYGDAGDLAARMSDYAEKNGIETVGPVYNVYLLDEVSVADPSEYLMRASVLVKE